MSTASDYCRRYQTQLPPQSLYRLIGKRLIDLLVCVPALVLCSPFLLVAIVLIRLDSRGPAFFVQKRLGRYGTTFDALKLRTMTDRERTPDTEILPGHSEVTRVGKWLRRFKVDELPQLINIVRGDMSLVGPRPALPDHILRYNADGIQRLLERPGLTGLAQVNGNIYLSWPDRWQFDSRYVARLSLLRDLGIVVKTVAVVLLGEARFAPASALVGNTADPAGLDSSVDASPSEFGDDWIDLNRLTSPGLESTVTDPTFSDRHAA